MENISLAETFNKYFDVTVAQTKQQKRDVYGIRYRVYCEEFGFESAEHFSQQMEFDEYDAQSTHCLITHIPTGRPAGCVRMVPTFSTEVRDPLPFEKYCSTCLDNDFIDALHAPRETMCEISRLAVDGAFRKRAGEKQTRCGEVEYLESAVDERRAYPLIAVSAFLASTAVTNLTHRTNVFMMTEPFLPKLLGRSGIVVQRAGEQIDYHGLRAPYFITSQTAEQGLKGDLKELYGIIFKKFERLDMFRPEKEYEQGA